MCWFVRHSLGENVLTDSKWRSWLKLATARREWAECQCSGAWKCFLLVPTSVLAPSISSHSHGHRDWHSFKVLHRALSLLCFSNSQTFDPTPQYFGSFLRCCELAAVFEVFSSFAQVKVTVPWYINTTTEVLQSEFYLSKSTCFTTKIYLNIQIPLCRKASLKYIYFNMLMRTVSSDWKLQLLLRGPWINIYRLYLFEFSVVFKDKTRQVAVVEWRRRKNRWSPCTLTLF